MGIYSARQIFQGGREKVYRKPSYPFPRVFLKLEYPSISEDRKHSEEFVGMDCCWCSGQNSGND